MTFTLTIELGNDAMRKGPDLADALEKVAGSVRCFGVIRYSGDGNIRDENGNSVGTWEVK